MLSLRKIVKNYVSGEEVVHALKGIDIDFRKSEFVSILGPSGCGKTTLLNIVGGLDKYTNGDLIMTLLSMVYLLKIIKIEIGIHIVIIQLDLFSKVIILSRTKQY